MNNASEPGMGFVPSVPSPKKRVVPDVALSPAAPAPVVNNYFNLFVDPNALAWIAVLAIALILLRVLFSSR